MKTVLVAALLAIATVPYAQGGGPVQYGYRVLNSYPHDTTSFTQGLIYRDGFLYESAGQYGRSSLRKLHLENGQILQHRPIDRKYFAEGLTEFGGKLIQLTWKENVAFVYDMATFAPEKTLSYTGQGWGLTHDGKQLILSDGSPTLRFLAPGTFRELGRVTVTDRKSPVVDLNELEYIRGEIYANIWNTDRIARISPQSGAVTGWIDLAGIWPTRERRDPDAVLNGIAYDAAGDRLFVTGKLWPRIYHIELVRR